MLKVQHFLRGQHYSQLGVLFFDSLYVWKRVCVSSVHNLRRAVGAGRTELTSFFFFFFSHPMVYGIPGPGIRCELEL